MTPSIADRLRQVPLAGWVETFVVANLAFLAIDIYLAHVANDFANRAEWVPVFFSIVAPLALAPGLTSAQVRARLRPVALLLGWMAIVVGVVGMLLHLRSGFFASQTLARLVYAAPFIAPLSYVGVGLLLILNHTETGGSLVWALWVLVLALGGFIGNFALSLLDHAQNGFFDRAEWVPVVSAAFAVSFLLLAVVHPTDARLRRACAGVLIVQAAVGVLGFALHALSDLYERPGETLRDRLIYGAPVFAPLLFTNLALLASIGLLSLKRVFGNGRTNT